jgi:hypothetical protein
VLADEGRVPASTGSAFRGSPLTRISSRVIQEPHGIPANRAIRTRAGGATRLSIAAQPAFSGLPKSAREAGANRGYDRSVDRNRRTAAFLLRREVRAQDSTTGIRSWRLTFVSGSNGIAELVVRTSNAEALAREGCPQLIRGGAGMPRPCARPCSERECPDDEREVIPTRLLRKPAR